MTLCACAVCKASIDLESRIRIWCVKHATSARLRRMVRVLRSILQLTEEKTQFSSTVCNAGAAIDLADGSPWPIRRERRVLSGTTRRTWNTSASGSGSTPPGEVTRSRALLVEDADKTIGSFRQASRCAFVIARAGVAALSKPGRRSGTTCRPAPASAPVPAWPNQLQ